MLQRLTYIITLILLGLSFGYAHNEGIRFIENKGQWDQKVLYRASLGNGDLFVEKNAFTFNLYNAEEISKNHISPSGKNTAPRCHAYKVNFLNALHPSISSKDKYPEYYNYFLGNNKGKWKSQISAYQYINYSQLYNNINLNLYSSGNFVKYDFIVKPGGNTDDIQLDYEGVDHLNIDNAGNLIIKTSVGDVIEQQPYSYQLVDTKKVEIKCKFVLNGNRVAFRIIGKYNKSIPLVIDPILIFASYSGSTADNFGMTATYGYDGSLFAGGTAFNFGYPTTTGAYDPFFSGSAGGGITDVVISRYDSTGSNLIYSTYIGGTATETVHSLIANENNELYLYGATSSLDFPTDANSFDNSFNGGTSVYYVSNGSNFTNGTDIYVAKLNDMGTSLLGSTYLGGAENDGVNSTINLSYDSLMNNYGDQYRGEIMLDDNSNCYITSSTKSPDFPIINGFDDTLNGNQDAIVVKLKSDLSDVYWSSYLGGDNMDAGFSVKVDSNYYVYVCGGTASNNFPTTPGAINTSYLGGIADGFITKIDTNGSQVLASTLLGTSEYDQCYFLETDRFGSVYVVGQTRGLTFPIINAPYSNPNSSNFIVKLNNNLDTVYYSSVFGNGIIGAKFSPSAFLVDRCGNVYVSGWGGDILTGTSLNGMPTSPNAFQPNTPNGFDFYLIVLQRDLQSMLYGTYFGGSSSREHVDGGTSRFDKNGIVYQSVCAGCWNNDDFPTTPGAWSNTNNSTGCNNGTFKFDFEIVPKAKFSVDNYEGCAPLTVTFTNSSNSSDYYLWDFGNGDTTSVVFNPIRTFTTPGTYNVSLMIRDSICNTVDTAYQTVVVNPSIDISSITNSTNSCDSITLDIDAIGATDFIWSTSPLFTDTINPNTLVDSVRVFGSGTVTYYVTASNGFCTDIDSVTITYHLPSPISSSADQVQGCAPLTVNFTNNSGPHDYYLWDFGDGNSTSTILNPTNTYTTPGNYTASLTIVDSICNTSFTQNIAITVAAPVTLNPPTNITTCDTALLFSNATNATSYIWSSNSSFTDTINTNLEDSLVVMVSDTTMYYVTATNGVCSAIDSIQVNFIGINISTLNGATCSGNADTLAVINHNSQPLTYSWTPVSAIISGENTATPIVNPTSTTTYYVTAQNSLGCSKTDSSIVVVSGFDPSNIEITADSDTLYNGESTYLHAIPNTNFSYLWNPTSSLNNPTIADPLATPTTTTTYSVIFTEISSGCSYARNYTLYAWELNCDEPDIFLPNAFTPNGDLENDMLFVRGRYVEEMLLKIYNRWGELVFETDKQSVGWDGTFKGQLVDPAVFVYYLTVKCIDGQDYFKKGNVTVIR